LYTKFTEDKKVQYEIKRKRKIKLKNKSHSAARYAVNSVQKMYFFIFGCLAAGRTLIAIVGKIALLQGLILSGSYAYV